MKTTNCLGQMFSIKFKENKGRVLWELDIYHSSEKRSCESQITQLRASQTIFLLLQMQ